MNQKAINISLFLLLAASTSWAGNEAETIYPAIMENAPTTLWENRIIPLFMIITGMGMMAIWAMDITAGKFRDQGHFFQWRNEGGDRLWLHIVAEYITAGGLIAGGVGLLGALPWGLNVSLVALGALAYTSINSLSWVFAQKDRLSYGIPIMISLAGSIISLTILLIA